MRRFFYGQSSNKTEMLSSFKIGLMHFSNYLLFIVFLIFRTFFSINKKAENYIRLIVTIPYIPLGKISFADSLVNFEDCSPTLIKKYRDSAQYLHEPDYKNYQTPNFISLGCGGILAVEFSDNGFMSLPGNDLYIFEVVPSREAARIEISENGNVGYMPEK